MAKRLNITLPQDLYDELRYIAGEHDTTISNMLRQAIKLLVLVIQTENDPDVTFLIREGGISREIKFII